VGRVLIHRAIWSGTREFRRQVLPVAGCLLIAFAVASAESIKKQFPTTSNPSFLLHNHNGKISITGWDQSVVDIQGEPASDLMEVIIMPEDQKVPVQKVSVQTHPKNESVSSKESRLDFQVHVPRQAAVRVESERGDIQVENLEGTVDIQGVSNAVTLSHLKGYISARTEDGNILVESSEGNVTADSISGNLRFIRVNGSELVANTNTGTIRYEGDFGQGGTYVLNNYNSPIEILATAKASFDLTARAVMGFIESNLPFRPTPLGNAFRRLSPRNYLQGRFNSGDSTVRVTSYSGTIRVRSLDGPAQ
jgi:DUF4097 and DUF4098 domain-containing protein YvlB